MLDTEKMVREAKEEGKVEAAYGMIKTLMEMGMRFEKAFSKAQEAIHLSDSSVKYLKEKFS